MDKIRTATGLELNCSSFAMLEDMGLLYIRVSGVSLLRVTQIFSDPRETIQLWYGNQYVSQYTKLDAIIPEGRVIRICLRKE